MAKSKSLLQTDPINWLLESENPSVRYLTLTELLEKPESSPDVVQAKRNIMESGPVPAILKHQNDGGFWGAEKDFYLAKYSGTIWQLIILAELGADERNTRIKQACEFVLAHSQDPESGGFAMNKSAKQGGGRHSEVIPCLTGNMLWVLIKFGYEQDKRVQRVIDWINEFQRFDDGISTAPTGWPYDKFEICWGKHTCHMGVVKTLKALAQIPLAMRPKAVQDTIDRAVEYLLIHHIFKKSHDYNSVSKPGWLRFGFPLMYQTDILEILLILTKLGCKDKRMQEAIDIVRSKQDKQGKLKLENSYNDRFLIKIEQKGKESKWITLNALLVLKRYTT